MGGRSAPSGRGQVKEACKLYEAAIEAAKAATASDLAVKYSRFLRLSLNDGKKAGEVLQAAVDREPSNSKLYLQQLDLLLHTMPLDVQNVTDLLDKAIKVISVLLIPGHDYSSSSSPGRGRV